MGRAWPTHTAKPASISAASSRVRNPPTSGRAVDQVRAGHQPSDRSDARPHRAADTARHRRRGDRIAGLCYTAANNKLHHGRTIMKSGIITAATSALLFSGVANAAEIKVLSTQATEQTYRELVPQFEQASGHKVTTIFTGTL